MLIPAHGRLAAWYFFYFAYIGAFAPYFTLYLQAVGLSALNIGILMSLSQVMRLLAPPLWGWLADRLGHRRAVVRASALLALLGFSAFFVTRDFAGMFVGMALMAFFWSASLPLVEALTLDHLQGRTERYGRIRLWGSVGFIVAVLAVGRLLDAQPIETLLWACVGLLGGILACAWTLPDSLPAAAPESAPLPLRQALRRPEVVALLAACFCMSAAHGPFYVFYSIHLAGNGYDKTAIGALWSAGVLAEIAAFLFMPRLLRRWSLRGVLLASFALAVARFLLMGWFPALPAVQGAAQLLHGATFGAYHAAAVAVLNRWFPARQQGRVQAVYGSVSFGAGGLLGALMSGLAWETLGAGLTYSLGSGFAALGFLLLWRGLSPAAVR